MGITITVFPQRYLLRAASMIFVTVGNALQGFGRLLVAVERESQQGILKGEDILFQSGHTTDFNPGTGRLVPFLPLDEFEENVRQAELVISHAGAGTLIHLFRTGKVPIVMPREKRYGEHVDDHQVELVKALVEQRRVVSIRDSDELTSAIKRARLYEAKETSCFQSDGLEFISQAMKELLHHS